MITVAAFLMLLSLAPSQSFRRKPKETSTAEAAPLSVSVCVPAIVADFHSNLPDLLASVAMQTVMPLEIIIVATGVPQDRCQTLRDELEAMSKIVLLTCLPELQNQVQLLLLVCGGAGTPVLQSARVCARSMHAHANGIRMTRAHAYSRAAYP